jgi:hypothetical protein
LWRPPSEADGIGDGRRGRKLRPESREAKRCWSRKPLAISGGQEKWENLNWKMENGRPGRRHLRGRIEASVGR